MRQRATPWAHRWRPTTPIATPWVEKTWNSFAIDRGNGQITVGAGSELDYETKDSYTVTVTANDTVRGSDEINVTIDVTIDVTNVDELGMVSGDTIADYARTARVS